MPNAHEGLINSGNHWILGPGFNVRSRKLFSAFFAGNGQTWPHNGKQSGKGFYHRRKSDYSSKRRMHQPVGFDGYHHKIVEHHAPIPVLGDS
jgi:hypothetical protein